MSGFNNRPNVVQRLTDNVAGNIAGIFSTRATAKYASGARSILKVNGRVCGFAFNISWRINTTVTEVMTIDDYMPYELAPQRIVVDGTISALHIPGTSAGTEIWQSDVLNFLFQRYITIEVRDSVTDQLLFFTDKAMITSRQEDVKVDSLASVQLSWKAIGFRDEREPERAQDVDRSKPIAADTRSTATISLDPLSVATDPTSVTQPVAPDPFTVA
jgi:hypothetical protein